MYLCIDVPVSVSNIKIIPINNNTVLMNWYYEKNDEVHCIQYYNVTIISDDNINIRMITNESSTTIPSLIIGTNYSFIIIPIDIIGREGPPSSLIQYIWNGKNYTHTHTHCISYSTSSSC